jgi:hypothetical protein
VSCQLVVAKRDCTISSGALIAQGSQWEAMGRSEEFR